MTTEELVMYLMFRAESWHSEKGKVAGYILDWEIEDILKEETQWEL